MIVAAHQLNFLPWMGYFDKMRRADLFVILDHVQFTRQNYQNRTKIRLEKQERWLTIPVVKGSQTDKMTEKEIDNSREGRNRWGHQVSLTLRYAYQSAPCYAEYEEALFEILNRHWTHLAPLNQRLIDFCREALSIRTPVKMSSELDIRGAKSDMVLEICKKTGADAYLSGLGGSKDYLDREHFEREGVRILWQDFKHPQYAQYPPGDAFIERLSVIDALFNCGTQAKSLLSETVPIDAEKMAAVQ